MREISVARAIIVNEKEEVLLGERAQGPGRGKMELPGGKVDPGETPFEAVVREVYEELGLIFTPHKLFKEHVEVSQEREGLHWRNFYYQGTVEGELRLDPEEVSSARYASIEQIVLFEMPFNQKDHVLEFFEKRRKGEL